MRISGSRAGVIGRCLSRACLPIVRTFISFPAGVCARRFWTLSRFHLLGSFIWCGAFSVGRFYLARWEELRRIMRPFDIPIAMAIVAFVAYTSTTTAARKAASGE